MDFIVQMKSGQTVEIKSVSEPKIEDGVLAFRHNGTLIAAFAEWQHFGNTQGPATSELQNQRDDLLAALQALRTMVKQDPEYVRWVQNNRAVQRAERAIAKAKGETTE